MAINRIKALALTKIEATTFTGSYLPINPSGAEGAAFYFRINNDTDGAVTVSFDGINDHIYLLEAEVYETPTTQNNSLPAGKVALFPKGQIIYVKASMGTGYLYLSGFYQPVGE
jgi:hypothetical protein